MDEALPVALPASLHRYFWDVDPARLTLDGGRYTILRRLLEKGGMDAFVWLRREIGDDEIRRFLISTHGRGISPKRLRFWELMLSLPHELVDGWIARYRETPWGARTRR